jgi:DnaJ-class molecular chaperone
MSDLYGVLGVGRRANAIQIKGAYRHLAKACHPDMTGGDKRAEQRFKEISCAYATLSNARARGVYDAKCAHQRAQARRRLRSAATTMVASFTLTVCGGLLVSLYLQGVLPARPNSEPPRVASMLTVITAPLAWQATWALRR